MPLDNLPGHMQPQPQPAGAAPRWLIDSEKTLKSMKPLVRRNSNTLVANRKQNPILAVSENNKNVGFIRRVFCCIAEQADGYFTKKLPIARTRASSSKSSTNRKPSSQPAASRIGVISSQPQNHESSLQKRQPSTWQDSSQRAFSNMADSAPEWAPPVAGMA